MEITGTTLNTGMSGTGSAPSVSREAFLELLLLQLKHQDPLDPVDNQTMLAQLAEFSTLEEMQNLNEAFQADLAASESINNALSTTLIGKEIKAVGK